MNFRKHPQIVALGYSEAAMLARRSDVRIAAVISIYGQREFPIEQKVAHRLDLHFDDVPAPDPSDPLSVYRDILRKRADEEVGLSRVAPTVDDAASIIQFAQSIRRLDGVVLCHCGGGVSRSPAAALLCLATWTEPGDEPYCVNLVRSFRPCAIPHADLVRFGDHLLGRLGRLISSLHGDQGSA